MEAGRGKKTRGRAAAGALWGGCMGSRGETAADVKAGKEETDGKDGEEGEEGEDVSLQGITRVVLRREMHV